MPGMPMHMSSENASFAPMKAKTVFCVFKPIWKEKQVNRICTLKTVFVLFNAAVHFDT